MCSCCIVNAIFTVTNAVLFPLHTLSLLLICLLCICKYVSIFYCSFSVFLMFPSRSRGFLRKAEKLLLPWSYLTSSQRLRLNLLPSTSPPSVPPLPHTHTHTHTHSDVYSFLTSRHRPSLLRSGHTNNEWRVCRFYKDATTRLSGVHESYFKLSKKYCVPHTSWKVRNSDFLLGERSYLRGLLSLRRPTQFRVGAPSTVHL